MRTTNRYVIGIMSLVLDIASQENYTRPSLLYNRIMHKVVIAHPALKDIVAVLTTYGLLSYDDVTQTYRTTEKGLQLLDKYNQILDVIKEEEEVESPRQD
jgi:predicted transcriptional regulator